MDNKLKEMIRQAIREYDIINLRNTVTNTVECLEAISIELQEGVVRMVNSIKE